MVNRPAALTACVLVYVVAPCFAEPAQAYRQAWDAPEVADRIADGIARHRTGALRIRLVDAAGRPVTNADVRIEQVEHEFLFGANIFMLGGFDTDEANRAYEKSFTDLFNAATVPFYWREYEPQPGVFRFEASSPAVRRRPPPDAVLEFCESRGLVPHGHPLVWDNPRWSVPPWLPADVSERRRLIAAWIERVAGRYGRRIGKWDVLNEPLSRHRDVPMPPDYEREAFQVAARALPPEARLFINETTAVWSGQTAAYVALVRRLRDAGARIDAVGMQFHIFKPEEFREAMAGRRHRPQQLFAALDAVAALGLPIHVSEITIPAVPNDDDAQADQALAARNFYRLWFSHPAVMGITWWNVADGTAAPGEDHLQSGLLTKDLSPKPSYRALKDLIRQEWMTRQTLKTEGSAADVTFRGFFGRYRYVAEAGGRRAEGEFRLSRSGPDVVTIRMPD